MSHPFPFVRIVLGGTISGAQGWSTGFACALGGAPTLAEMQAIVDKAAFASDALWHAGGSANLAGINAPDTRQTSVKGYYYPAGSGAATVQAEQATFPSPLLGTSGAFAPAVTCLVASMMTGVPGKSFRGRMYLPATGLTIGADHNITQALCGAIANRLAAFFDSVQAVILSSGGVNVGVAGKTAFTAVNRIVIDSEPDVQRRRAEKLHATTSDFATVT